MMLPLSPSRYTNQTFDGSSIRLMYSASCWRATKLLVGGTGTAAVARSIAVCCAATFFASCPFDFSGTQPARSDEHTSEPQSLMRSSSAVFCLNKKIFETYYK